MTPEEEGMLLYQWAIIGSVANDAIKSLLISIDNFGERSEVE
jgi:hypothetical protein